jgi:uncharacterized protein
MAALESARVLLTGSSGLLGTALLACLKSRGFDVTRLVRGRVSGEDQIHWDPMRPPSPESLAGVDAVIHLAGETVVGRWTAAKKTKIRDSRVTSTRNLVHAMTSTQDRPRVFICASAIGYYGDRHDEPVNEMSSAGGGFLADVCREWEAATKPAADAGIRTVQLRTGVVLSREGGALCKMLLPFRLGVGGRVGSGRQWMSWIHIHDWVGAVQHILRNDLLQGPVNMVAPKPVTNTEFTTTLALVLSRPAIFPVPSIAVKLAFGEMAQDVLLASQRVEPARLVHSGYPFQYSDLSKALQAILKP